MHLHHVAGRPVIVCSAKLDCWPETSQSCDIRLAGDSSASKLTSMRRSNGRGLFLRPLGSVQGQSRRAKRIITKLAHQAALIAKVNLVGSVRLARWCS